MPLDVIMPALGMAQETGVIVAWHKKPGDQVAEGDVLFEVETDKATMEVEAQRSGFLGAVTAKEGDEVAVGKTIARISDSAEDTSAEPETEASAPDSGEAEELPDGKAVIMPTLGMAQDSGLLVAWLVEPGGKVGADDPLFEVETDKSTMEVPAGVDGYLAAQLAEAGEEVPTGQTIAIVSAEPPEDPIIRSAASGAPAPAPATAATPELAEESPEAPAPAKTAKTTQAPSASGRILASPKARRLALEQGLDLARLAAAGHPQPFHVKDLEALKDLPAETSADTASGGPTTRHLTAEIPGDAFAAFADWAAAEAGLGDPSALLAGLAGGCLELDTALVAHEALGRRRLFTVPRGAPLGAVTEAEDGAPDLVLRDLRLTRISALTLGAEEAPTLTLTTTGESLTLTLECAPGELSAPAAVSLLSDFAGRLEQPLRALL